MSELTIVLLVVALLYASLRLQSMMGMGMWSFVAFFYVLNQMVGLSMNFFWMSVILCSLVLAMAQAQIAMAKD